MLQLRWNVEKGPGDCSLLTVVTGPRQHARSYLEGLTTLANMRLCANVPSQWAIQTALSAAHGIDDLVLPGGRLLEQRDVAYEMLNAIPGVSCTKPKGALYCFPKLDPKVQMKNTIQLMMSPILGNHIENSIQTP